MLSLSPARMLSKTMLLVSLACFFMQIQAFATSTTKSHGTWGVLTSSLQTKATDEAVDAFGNATKDVIDDISDYFDKNREERQALKRTMLQLGASYDRGFGASPKARKEAESTIVALELLNQETWAAQGISGNETSPLEGSWRMTWTNAQDVLLLGASPVATVGAIYQVFEPPVVTNIIDFIPRAQALLPPSMAMGSLVRAKVTTRASFRLNKPNRVGLVFEKVALQPVEILGQSVDLPPLGFDLPQIASIVGMTGDDGPGYFDVTFLDEEMLIIRQNAPGGLFVLTKVPDNDP